MSRKQVHGTAGMRPAAIAASRRHEETKIGMVVEEAAA